MRLFGYEITASPREPEVISLFGSDRFDVEKAYGVPAGASINPSVTADLRGIAAGQSLGSALPAYGIRPNAGTLPDARAEADGDPLRFQIPWGGNLTYTPRSGFGTPFSILRGLAATSPVLALCIQCRKDQMASLDWDFAARDKKASADVDARLARARAFFAKPDGRRSHKSWIQLLVDEALTIDAAAIYRHPNNKGAVKLAAARAARKSYTLAPDEISSYDIIDGATIKVLLDDTGDIPVAPAIAYRQVIYGAPMVGGDLTTDQLLYRPKTERTWTPYGLSPIEAALLVVTANLNRDLFNLSYYSEGNIPEALAGVPDTWSPKQIKQWQEYWDLVLKGDPKNRSRLRFVVQAMAKSVHEFKKPDFTTQYDLWLLKLQCACFGVTPSEIGFTDDVNKATSKTQGDVNQRRGVKPMANFIKAIQDDILCDIGLGDLESTWTGGEGEDALTQARIADINLRNGRVSLDELRAQDGNPTIGAGPAVYTATGPVFIEDVIAQSEAAGVPSTGGDADPDLELPPPSAAAEPKADDTKQAAMLAELKKYQTVATKAVRAGAPVPAFSSVILPQAMQASLTRSLAAVQTIDDAQKVFADARGRVQKAQRLSAKQQQAQRRLYKKLGAIFADMRKDFAAHVASGVEA